MAYDELIECVRARANWRDEIDAGTRDLLDEAADALTTLQSRIAILEGALEPFASFADANVDDDGWNDVGLSTKNERVVDWFGPSDFRKAHESLRNDEEGEL